MQSDHSSHHADRLLPIDDGRRHVPYLRLLAMVILSFASMYGLMFAVATYADHAHDNVSQVHMAALMACPMVLIELALMWKVYASSRLNVALVIVSVAAMGVCWTTIRAQAVVSHGTVHAQQEAVQTMNSMAVSRHTDATAHSVH